MHQQILVMETDGPGLRSEAHGWNLDCGLEAKKLALANASKQLLTQEMTINSVEVWKLRSPNEFHTFKTPLHALAAGWRLMARPASYKMQVDCDCDDPGDPKLVYEWWFEKLRQG